MENDPNPTKDFYDQHAEKWAFKKTNSFYHESQFRKFSTHFSAGDKILDIGCANGIHVPLFLGLGYELKYEGIDISNSFLQIARARYPQLSFSEADLLDASSLPEGKYDGFWAAAVLMHIPLEHWPEMLSNIEGMMKPGAIGYVTVPQERFADSEADPRHFEIFDTERFTSLVGTRGWKVLETGAKGATDTNDWLWFLVQLP